MSVFDVTTPVGTEAKSLGDDRIRELKQALQDALQADGGVFPGAAPTTAPVYYPVMKRDVAANKPAASVNYPGRMYSESDTGNIQRVKNDGSAWEIIVKDPSSNAIHQAAAAALASVAGVLTLPETGNSFNATGTEAITSIAGWSAGLVIIKWASARIITHNATSLILRGGVSRNVDAGDIHIFECIGSGQVREVSFLCPLGAKAVGEPFMWPSSIVPVGALECAGQSLLQSAYPGLFAAIGTAFGSADASHFNLPDMRGQFPRGWDHGAGNDPDSASRIASNTGGAIGDNVGSKQTDQFASHTHTVTGAANTITKANGSDQDGLAANQTTSATGGNETRPKNVNFMFCIKY